MRPGGNKCMDSIFLSLCTRICLILGMLGSNHGILWNYVTNSGFNQHAYIVNMCKLGFV